MANSKSVELNVRKRLAEQTEPTIRKPEASDGAAVYELISECPPLDENSMYCNLLQCSHFAETSALAEIDGEPYAFVSGYIHPEDPTILFVWQVAVHENMRGKGLGKKLLSEILNRAACKNVSQLQTTITRNNKASWGLFKSFAKDLDASCHDEVMFHRKEHFAGAQASEHLLTIGPFKRALN